MRQKLSRPWSEGDLSYLRSALADGKPISAIGRRLRRTESSVRGKMTALGLHVQQDARSGDGSHGYLPASTLPPSRESAPRHREGTAAPTEASQAPPH